jgi:hypothetical protein
MIGDNTLSFAKCSIYQKILEITKRDYKGYNALQGIYPLKKSINLDIRDWDFLEEV